MYYNIQYRERGIKRDQHTTIIPILFCRQKNTFFELLFLIHITIHFFFIIIKQIKVSTSKVVSLEYYDILNYIQLYYHINLLVFFWSF